MAALARAIKEPMRIILKKKVYGIRHGEAWHNALYPAIGEKILPSLKLSPRWLGPFKILAKKGPNTVELELPKRLSRVETIQNVSWLKPYKSRPADLGPAVVRPTPEVVGDHVEDEVEVILADRYKGKKTQFLVRFSGYGPEADLWLPLKNLKNCPEKMAQYWDRQKVPRA